MNGFRGGELTFECPPTTLAWVFLCQNVKNREAKDRKPVSNCDNRFPVCCYNVCHCATCAVGSSLEDLSCSRSRLLVADVYAQYGLSRLKQHCGFLGNSRNLLEC